MTKEEQSEPEAQEKHAGGRPLLFDTVEKLDLAIQLYFDRCDPHIEKQMVATGVSANGQTMFDTREVLTEQKPYTISGLARALGTSRRTLLNYAKRDEFFPSIQAAKQKCEEYAESQLFSPYANGAKFNLINNYSEEDAPWSDKHNVDHTSKGEAIKALVEFSDGGPVADGEDQGT